MFTKSGELKKIMKASLKSCGLIVGNIQEHYLVCSDRWGLYVEQAFATNKFKAAIMELIGDLPERGECYRYTVETKKEIRIEPVTDWLDPYGEWKRAKGYAMHTPLILFAFPREYILCQMDDLSFLAVRRDLTSAVISASELDEKTEHMPGRPSILGSSVLYYKNETMIYWVEADPVGEKVEEVIFPHLEGISFFERDWLAKKEIEETDGKEAANEPLPY